MSLPYSNALLEVSLEYRPKLGLGKRTAYFIALVLLLDDNAPGFCKRSFSITSDVNVSTLLMDRNVMKSITLIFFATKPFNRLDVEYVSI